MKPDKEEIRINLCDTCRKGCKVRREAIVSECSKYKLEPKAETILEQPKEVERCKCNSSKKTYNEQKHYYEDVCITCGKPIVEEKECRGKYEESQTLRNCLDYCRHRLKKHQNTGLHKIGCQLEFVEELERTLFPKQPDIRKPVPPKPQVEIEPLSPFRHTPPDNFEQVHYAIKKTADKIDELIQVINQMKERAK
jgi:hypothetical protein